MRVIVFSTTIFQPKDDTFRQTDIKRSYECWFTLDFRKLMAKSVKFWQIPRLFRGKQNIEFRGKH